jgi:hypothetical protein
MTPEELSRTSDDVFRERLESAFKRAGAAAGGAAGRATGKVCRVALDLLARVADQVFPRHDTCAQRHAVPIATYRILHALLPARDREVIERELEEQLRNDAENPLLGPRFARWYYRWRAITNLTWCAWNGFLTVAPPVAEIIRKLRAP